MTDPNTMAFISILTAICSMFVFAILWDSVQHARVFVRRFRAQRAMRAHNRKSLSERCNVIYFRGDHGISPRELRENYPTFLLDINCGDGVHF
jgi:hypothetical protein